MDAQTEITESYKQQIANKSIIYKADKRKLKEFEKKVNAAAVELCLKDVTLLKRR